MSRKSPSKGSITYPGASKTQETPGIAELEAREWNRTSVNPLKPLGSFCSPVTSYSVMISREHERIIIIMAISRMIGMNFY